MACVGIIANPSSGKDIRRLVAHGSVFNNNEKVNIVRRVLLGLDAAGVDTVLTMPDAFNICWKAQDNLKLAATVRELGHTRGVQPERYDTRSSTDVRPRRGLHRESGRRWYQSRPR